MNPIRLLTPTLALAALVGCSDSTLDPAPSPSAPSIPNDADRAGYVVVPDGSVDALADAIAEVGPWGTVVLATGTHTENETVLIEHPVTLKGHDGAVLVTASIGSPELQLDPAIHVRGTSRVTVTGVRFESGTPIGNTAVLLEDSDASVLRDCKFDGFQQSIFLQQADRTVLIGNTINASTEWQTGEIPSSYGIVVANGDQVWVVGNEVSGALFGIWACDERGRLLRNDAHDNLIGIILCKVPDDGFALPDGTRFGSEFSGNHWFVRGNDASSNLDTGYLVIDGANNNILLKNTGSGNGAYDMELTADTERFGFLTPASFDNLVVATLTPELRIKDCGDNNRVFGGTQIDIDEDPCY
jgi:hypothetical protein